MDMETCTDEDDITDSALVNDFNSERNSSSGSVVLKRGQWSEEEDVILKNYVEKHGQGNWNAVQRFSGLSRCGKSCRLRWTNHLRPDLKKGPFSPEEERKVIELHAKVGSKWALIAAELDGRTDNETKNFWNTRCKRRQRAGLPIYPPDIIPSENQQKPETPPISNVDIPSSNCYIDAGYDDIELFKIPDDSILRTHSSARFLNVPVHNMLPQVLQPNPSYSFSGRFSDIHPQPPVPSGNSNFMSVPLNLQDLDHGYQSFNNINPTIDLSDPPQAFGISPNDLTMTGSSFTSQSNRELNMDDHQLQSHELSTTVNGFYSVSDDPALSFNADTNGYSFIEPSFESTLLELPSIQNSVSDLSFMSDDHLPLIPQIGPSTLQLPTNQDSTDPADRITDEFFSYNAALETYNQNDIFQEYAPDVATSVENIQFENRNESNNDDLLAVHEVRTAGVDLVLSPTVSDSDRGYTYQLEASFPNEWFDGSIDDFHQELEYMLLDPEMSAFIGDEDVTVTPP